MALKIEHMPTAPAVATKTRPVSRFSLRRAWPLLVVAALLLALMIEGTWLLQTRWRETSDAKQIQLGRQVLARSGGVLAEREALDTRQKAVQGELARLNAGLAAASGNAVSETLALAARSKLAVTTVTADKPSQQRVGKVMYGVQKVTVNGRAALEDWHGFLGQVERGALGFARIENSRVGWGQDSYVGTATISIYSRVPEAGATPTAGGQVQPTDADLTRAWDQGGWELTILLLERNLFERPDDREVRRLLVNGYLRWSSDLSAQGEGARAGEMLQRAREVARVEPALLQQLESQIAPKGAQ